MRQKSIYVSKPKIKNKNKLFKDLRDIINSSIYTNDGPCWWLGKNTKEAWLK